jgi:hypothetical protein
MLGCPHKKRMSGCKRENVPQTHSEEKQEERKMLDIDPGSMVLGLISISLVQSQRRAFQDKTCG